MFLVPDLSSGRGSIFIKCFNAKSGENEPEILFLPWPSHYIWL